MLKIIIAGYGVMGKVLEEVAKRYDDIEIMAICDKNEELPSIREIHTDADVVIDFSVPDAVYDIVQYCEKHKVPLVSAVTGYSDEQEKIIDKLSQSIPVLRSSNFSIGMNVMRKLVQKATEILEWDAEIIEMHHNRKKDTPSGTAIMLKKSIGKDINIHSVRAGSIIGEHTVLFAGDNEIIGITHRAFSKNIFAEGAIKAARFIAKAPKGMYDMDDIL